MKSALRRLAAALGLGSFIIGSAGAATAPRPARPALWAVSDADTTIYLFGTIHLLPEQYQWRTAKFDRAVQNSQQLVIETLIDVEHPEAFAAAFAQMALSPKPLPPILDRVKTEKRAALAAAIRKVGATPEQLDRVKTWAVGFQLLSLQFAELGVLGKEGPETILRKEFSADRKSVDQLETITQQLSFFDQLSEQAQRDFLEGTLEDPAAARKEFGAMLASWSRGDEHAIATAFNRDMAGSSELSKSLIETRNATWSKWIERRMAEPGAIMVAVGAGHLAGKKSVVARLKRDGYRVRRLQ